MSILLTIHAVIAAILALTILLQHRTSGLTATFGGSGAVYVQRRGAEKMIFKLSIWLSVLFFGLAIVEWYVKF